MPRETTPPGTLPTAGTSTSFFNANTLFSHSRNSLLSTMGTFVQPPRARPLPPPEDALEDEVYDDHLGVGVKDGKQKARELNQENEALRNKMFGKKRAKEELKRREEGSSEDEEGRGGLGRRKKKMKRARTEGEESVDVEEKIADGSNEGNVDEGQKADSGQDGVDTTSVVMTEQALAQSAVANSPAKKKQKNKNKNKKKRKEAE